MRALRLPRLRKRLWLAVGGLYSLQLGGLLGITQVLAGSPTPLATMLLLAGLSLLIMVGLGVLIDQRLCKPLVATTRGSEILAGSNPGHQLEVPSHHWLERLPKTITALATALSRSRHELEESAAAWNARIEARKARLETILREIREGVIVCDRDGGITLYNSAAKEILSTEPALGLGRSIDEVLSAGPLRHTLGLVAGDTPQRNASLMPDDAELVCASASGERLLRCRVARLGDAELSDGGFVMTLQDVSRQTRETLRREQALRAAVESLRAPITNLSTASESLRLAQREGLNDDAQRFGEILSEESHRLTEDFSALSAETTSMLSENWRLDDTHLGSLIDGIKGSERAHRLPRLQCRVDVWVAAEAYLLSQVIESLLLRLQADLGVTAVAVSGREEGSLVYLDFNWSGDVVAPDQLDHWLDTGLDDVGGTVTLREVLQRHDTTVWSQPDLSRANRGLLRLPLPGAPDKQHTLTRLPARPEFYDAQVDGDESQALGDRADTPLSQLDYVVFDCETTGLEPSQGDEIVSIAAVRIHRGRVMHGESFELLTNPGRDIPALATSFHGIRAEDVADAPPVEEAIRRFHAFAGNAVLVGFNVAFDMRFLKLKQRRCDVRFDHPTLDALLLSILLHNHTGEHTMEGIAERLGVGVGGRHTALGDSLTTAEIFIRLIDLLPGESIHTLDDAITAQERMIEYRRQQRAF